MKPRILRCNNQETMDKRVWEKPSRDQNWLETENDGPGQWIDAHYSWQPMREAISEESKKRRVTELGHDGC